MKTQAVYVLDHACYKPPREWSVTLQESASIFSTIFNEPELEKVTNRLEHMPLSDMTYWPPAFQEYPLRLSIEKSKDEMGEVFESAVVPFLANHNLRGSDLDVVVTACSVFASVPPQSARLCNTLGCRSDVTAFNMSGTGDSLGASAVSLGAKLIKEKHAPGYALVVVAENLSCLLYSGNDDRFLESDVTYRLGCSMILLTTHKSDKACATYKIVATGGLHPSVDPDQRFEEFMLDSSKKVGFRWNNNPESYAQKLKQLLEQQISQLSGTLDERAAARSQNLVKRILKGSKEPIRNADPLNVDHIILQPSHPDLITVGYESIGLGNAKNQQESSKAAFWRFGNTGPSGIWYALNHRESSKGIQKGESVLMIGISGRLYVNSLVLQSVKNNHTPMAQTWSDIINDTETKKKIEMEFDAYLQGKKIRSLERSSSTAAQLRQESQNPQFYPYIHGVFEADMSRFKEALAEMEPQYHDFVMNSER
jgi:3-oxoacyl-[acyl-carrier-protein] synthase III